MLRSLAVLGVVAAAALVLLLSRPWDAEDRGGSPDLDGADEVAGLPTVDGAGPREQAKHRGFERLGLPAEIEEKAESGSFRPGAKGSLAKMMRLKDGPTEEAQQDPEEVQEGSALAAEAAHVDDRMGNFDLLLDEDEAVRRRYLVAESSEEFLRAIAAEGGVIRRLRSPKEMTDAGVRNASPAGGAGGGSTRGPTSTEGAIRFYRLVRSRGEVAASSLSAEARRRAGGESDADRGPAAGSGAAGPAGSAANGPLGAVVIDLPVSELSALSRELLRWGFTLRPEVAVASVAEDPGPGTRTDSGAFLSGQPAILKATRGGATPLEAGDVPELAPGWVRIVFPPLAGSEAPVTGGAAPSIDAAKDAKSGDGS